MQHQISNTGPTAVCVVDGFGDEVVIEPGVARVGVIQSVKLPDRGRVEFTIEPFDDGKR